MSNDRHIVLHMPQIPHNTGNIMRLCSNTGAKLHLIRPIGFSLKDRHMRRAALDYSDVEDIIIYENFDQYLTNNASRRILVFSSSGTTGYSDIVYSSQDSLVFGSESEGLPLEILNEFPPERIIKIPMMPSNRSLNLSNAVAVVLYEAWRQDGFINSEPNLKEFT